ncbi:cobalamin adenosyltransferase [Polaribacter sp. ALD11]|uniref:cobalamin adenosyltransferase n=1 Tax=Polaribacter sp. ALD11 TaxID=2058137 RepID=UPI000C3049BF|nr:cobalamin adenosyltransferase [Polaribacter sp. ALD11]AUC84033.1 cobalamin adenosyltransferase [Polaribacter sp. ALD11]
MKKLRPKPSIDELCYPFIYEESTLCDYEIITDQLTRLVGWVIDELRELRLEYPNSKELKKLEEELNWLLPLCYHLNGSIRGKLAISEEDHLQLLNYYRAMKKEVDNLIHGFVLPGGRSPVGVLNQCSSLSKKAIRLMVIIHNKENKEVANILPKFANLLCNYFFTATILINKVTGFVETPFVSKSY